MCNVCISMHTASVAGRAGPRAVAGAPGTRDDGRARYDAHHAPMSPQKAGKIVPAAYMTCLALCCNSLASVLRFASAFVLGLACTADTQVSLTQTMQTCEQTNQVSLTTHS